MLPGLKVSENKRYLVTTEGTPFFYLADTAWELLHRLTREEIERYLVNRAEKGFTAVQVVLLTEFNGATTPNAYGELPFEGLDPRRPNERWFELVDHLVARCGALGLRAALLPSWGCFCVREQHPLFENHYLFPPDAAYDYGRWLGERYREQAHIVWIMGGDRGPDEGDPATFSEMARGLAEGGGGRVGDCPWVMTFHPRGGQSSAEFFHESPWLSFNMVQSGHLLQVLPRHFIEADYARVPVKPVLNGEPGYEQIPIGIGQEKSKISAHHVRRLAWSSLFAGACGHTYGANEVWMMWEPRFEPIAAVVKPPFLAAERPWYEALDYEGAGQMRHIRALFESRPMLDRIPDNGLLAGGAYDVARGFQGTRAADGSYAFVLFPERRKATVRLPNGGRRFRAAWYDPMSGRETAFDEWDGARDVTVQPPESGRQEWILTLDAL